MHKVIVECYRHGRGPEKHGRRANIPFEDRPTKEGMRRAHKCRKFFGENLNPLRRWLRSQVGRPWNKVYSEACQVIRPDSVVRNHIKVHLLEMVQRHTFMKRGTVWCFRETIWSCGEAMPVREACRGWSPFYVHPKSGLLKEVTGKTPNPPHPYSWAAKQEKFRSQNKWIAKGQLLHKSNGLWFECQMKSWGRDSRGWKYDLIQKKEITSGEAWDIYGERIYCVAKQQLSAKQLATHRLKNDPHMD